MRVTIKEPNIEGLYPDPMGMGKKHELDYPVKEIEIEADTGQRFSITVLDNGNIEILAHCHYGAVIFAKSGNYYELGDRYADLMEKGLVPKPQRTEE